MDLNLKWWISKWVINNLTDLIFWGAISNFVANAVMKNVPEAKDTWFKEFCDIINSLYSGMKGLRGGKGATK